MPRLESAEASAEEPQKKRVVVVGDGFLAAEVAAAIRSKCAKGSLSTSEDNAEVFLISSSSGVADNILPPYLATFATEQLREMGMTVMTETEVLGVLSSSPTARELSGAGRGEEKDEEVIGNGPLAVLLSSGDLLEADVLG